MNGGLYCIKSPDRPFAGAAHTDEVIPMTELHSRLGHIAPEAIRQMLKDNIIVGLRLDPMHTTMGSCESCEYAKATRKAIGKIRNPPRREHIGDEVHSDLWGPSPVLTGGQNQYYVSFTDDHTRFTKLYLQKLKSDTFESYLHFEAWLRTQFNTPLKRLRSDRGGEYLSDKFSKHLKANGTERKLTVHDTPEHNGLAEQLNRRYIERTCAMLHASGLPKSLWGEAIMHANWLKN